MKRPCDACGKAYEAKTSRSRFCSRVECVRERARGRKRVQRSPAAHLAPVQTKPAAGAELDAPGSVEAATWSELEKAGRSGTVLGQAAMVLARRLDGSQADTGSGVASLVKELRATVGEALKDSDAGVDSVDELRARRQKRLHGG